MAWPSYFREASDDYAGVLAQAGGVRLIVSARGAEYALQEAEGGQWSRFRSFSGRSELSGYLLAVMVDPAPEILAGLAGLPDDPISCAQVPVPPRA